MITLIVVGFLAGVITSISPCVLPVLPVVLTAGSNRRTPTPAPVPVSVGAPESPPEPHRRPAGDGRGGPMASSPVGAQLLSVHFVWFAGAVRVAPSAGPASRRRHRGAGRRWCRADLGSVRQLLERPFARIRGRQVNPDSNGLVTGLGLGLLFVPCAGPVLATIHVVVGATHKIGFDAVVLTIAFGIGVGVPLLWRSRRA